MPLGDRTEGLAAEDHAPAVTQKGDGGLPPPVDRGELETEAHEPPFDRLLNPLIVVMTYILRYDTKPVQSPK